MSTISLSILLAFIVTIVTATQLPVIKPSDWATMSPDTRGIPCFWLCLDKLYDDNLACDAMCNGGGGVDPDCLLKKPGVSQERGTSVKQQIIDRQSAVNQVVEKTLIDIDSMVTNRFEIEQRLETATSDMQKLLVFVSTTPWDEAIELKLRGVFSERESTFNAIALHAHRLYDQAHEAAEEMRGLEAISRCFE